MERNGLLSLAQRAYTITFTQSEDRIVREALDRYADSDYRTDYIESYLMILQQQWVDFVIFKDAFNNLLGEDEKLSASELEELLKDDYQITNVQNHIIGTSLKYIRPAMGHEDEELPEEVEIKVPTLNQPEKERVVSIISSIVSTSPNQTVLMAKLGPELSKTVDYKSMGYPRLSDLIEQLNEVFEMCEDTNGAKCIRFLGSSEAKTESSLNVRDSDFSDPVSSKVVAAIVELSLLENGNKNGWVSVVKLAPILKKQSIDYKQRGFIKLRSFLESLGNVIELHQVSSTILNVRAHLDDMPIAPEKPKEEVVSSMARKVNESPYEKFIGFAFFPPKNGVNGFVAMLNDLEEICLDEKWEYGDQKIIQNYLLFSFDQILYEDAIAEKRGMSENEFKLRKGKRYAVFNTGLVNGYYSPVFALFKSATNSKRPWVFDGFHTGDERTLSSVRKEEGWEELPKPARFYDSVEDLVFDTSYSIDAVNWKHIIIDNVERIPAEYIRLYSPKGFVIEDSPERPMQYYENLKAAIKRDAYWYRKLVKLFSDAMDVSIKHVTWNFHYAIPMYYPRQHKVSMLLPLNLGDKRDGKIDLVLVLEKDKAHHSYIANTIMTLNQIYCNVRLISKMDDDFNWLRSAIIEGNKND